MLSGKNTVQLAIKHFKNMVEDKKFRKEDWPKPLFFIYMPYIVKLISAYCTVLRICITTAKINRKWGY